jgi:putative heme-binding domain-containing protein
LRELILGGLLSRPAGQVAVLERIERGEFPAAAVDANVAARLPTIPTRRCASGRGKYLAHRPGIGVQPMKKAKAVLALKADAKHGREVFRQACATCHRLDREGAAVGPDLFGMANQPKETILLHIVVPDHELAPGFAAYACETKDGRTFAGVLASETPEEREAAHARRSGGDDPPRRGEGN